VPIKGIRKRISDHMRHAKATAAHFTYVDEVDVTELVQLREALQPLAEEQGVKLTYLPFIVKATIGALKKHPELNAHVDYEKEDEGKIEPDEIRGSTFTITSLGPIGGLLATPVINTPEVAILGVHEIKKRPVVVDNEIAIRDVMNLSCSFDHRVIDGHVGAAFVKGVKALLEDPKKLLVHM